MFLGAHMTGPLSTVPERTEGIGGNTFQIFSHSPRTWRVKDGNDEFPVFLKNMKKSQLETDRVMIHASYLINLASPKEEVWEKSKILLGKELELAHELGIKYVNVHPGSGLGDPENVAMERIARAIDEVMSKVPKDSELLLEIVSPKGGNVGYNFFQLKNISDMCAFPLKFTYDTCHGFDGGYDIRTEDGLRKLLDEIDGSIGREKLVMCHLNDSMFQLGEHRDRHERIGKGHIGIEGFRNFFSSDFFRSIPMLLETPGNDSEHAEDIRVVKDIVAAIH